MSVEEILLKDNEYKAIAEAHSYLGASFDCVTFNLQALPERDPELQRKIDERWGRALQQNPNMKNNPAIAVDLQSMGVREIDVYRGLVDDYFFRKAGGREPCSLNVGIYESCYKDMFATSREYADNDSVFLVGSKGLYQFSFEERSYLLFGLRNAGHTDLKGRTQALPAGMMDKKDLNVTLHQNQQLNTLRREYEEEMESEKLADGSLKCGPAAEQRWARETAEHFLGFSVHSTLGSFDADYFLVHHNNWNEKTGNWARQHKMTQDGYLLRIEKQNGKFLEHEVVWGVPLDRLSDFIEEKQDKISVASRWLLWRALNSHFLSL